VQKLCHDEGGLIYARTLLATRLNDAAEAFSILSSLFISTKSSENVSTERDEKIIEVNRNFNLQPWLFMTPCTDGFCGFRFWSFIAKKKILFRLQSFDCRIESIEIKGGKREGARQAQQ
jgi:hypothetical protein